MKIRFLGQEFDTPYAFGEAFPAYATYVALVIAGADTPHKVELEIHRRNQARKGKGKPLGSFSRKARRAKA